jgi:hypothetical protein
MSDSRPFTRRRGVVMNAYSASKYDDTTFAVYDVNGAVESYGYFSISEAQRHAEQLNSAAAQETP